jgi:hypothetical protein
MTWIKTISANDADDELRGALARARAGYPVEYSPEGQKQMRVPDAVRNDSIVMSHSLIPRALEHFFAGHAALMDPALPLERRQHELIAATVSALNHCFY